MADPLKSKEEPMRVTQANLWEGKAFIWLKFLLVLVWGIAVNE